MKHKDVKKVVTKKTDERPSFYHDAYKYLPQIDSKDLLLNNKYNIFSKLWDDDESEDGE